jgi:hypothetical protein
MKSAIFLAAKNPWKEILLDVQPTLPSKNKIVPDLKQT